MGRTGPRRRGDTQPERAQTSARVSTVEKPWNAWNCRRCWMVQTELTGEQRQTAPWSEIDWTATEAVVKRLQGRIYRAAAAGNGRQVKNLQKLLVRSTSAKRLAVRRVAQQNAGRNTPGLDGVVCGTPSMPDEFGYRSGPQGLPSPASPPGVYPENGWPEAALGDSDDP